MYNRLIDFIRKKSIIYPKQFGFREQHSTDHALLSIVDKIQNSIDNREYSCGIFLDFSKAFDTVNHEILIQKLEHYGIRKNLCAVIVYLPSNQFLVVCLKDPCWVLYYFFCILMILVTVLVYLICIFLQTMPIYSTQIYELQKVHIWLCSNKLSLNVINQILLFSIHLKRNRLLQ
jgi:hypothetical protein